MILILGASGQLGRLVSQALLAKVPAKQLRLASRHPEQLNEFADVEKVFADYSDPASLSKAMQGVKRLLLISGDAPNDQRLQQHMNVLSAAKAAAVEQLVYTSFQLATLDSAFDFARTHAATEAAIVHSGVPYTLVRNGPYAELQLAGLEHTLATETMLNAGENGLFAPVWKADLAEAIAGILSSESPVSSHLGQTYTLTGPELLNQAQVAQYLSQVSGKNIRLQNISVAELEQIFLGIGLPGFMAKAFANNSKAIADGEYQQQSTDLERLLGRPGRSLKALFEQSLTQS
ncbi:MAG: SDR family oxidoreductase [Shewanella algae]